VRHDPGASAGSHFAGMPVLPIFMERRFTGGIPPVLQTGPRPYRNRAFSSGAQSDHYLLPVRNAEARTHFQWRVSPECYAALRPVKQSASL